jgi:hypothetical protein
VIHIYYSPSYVRASFPPELFNRILPTQEGRDIWNSGVYDEKSVQIKIKKDIYVVEIIEQNMTKGGGTGNSLLFLMNLARVHDTGRSFGYHPDPNASDGTAPENYLFGAHGVFVPSDGKIESAKSLYHAE